MCFYVYTSRACIYAYIVEYYTKNCDWCEILKMFSGIHRIKKQVFDTRDGLLRERIRVSIYLFLLLIFGHLCLCISNVNNIICRLLLPVSVNQVLKRGRYIFLSRSDKYKAPYRVPVYIYIW